jgi:uncharacterized protein
MYELALIGSLLGHIGIWCTIFNLVHATAWPRWLRKSFEAGIYLSIIVIGLTIVSVHFQFSNVFILQSGPLAFANAYAWAGLTYFVYQFVQWIIARQLSPETQANLDVKSRVIDTLSNGRPAQINGAIAQFFMAIPSNQFAKIAVESKTLLVPRLPDSLEGLKIAHISDLHFTGKISRRYFEIAFEQVNAFLPDIVCVTGDIVDCDDCLNWVDQLFPRLTARYGQYFILGNHDARLTDVGTLRDKLSKIGFVDVNGSWQTLRIKEKTISIAGNELPWFKGAENLHEHIAHHNGFKLLLSHTPDHAYWANHHGFDFVLAGHNHGGQIRFPLIGPIVSPSWYGVRFASGSFLIDQMAMHVSRGLSSDDPIRFNCLPELTLLTLSRGLNSERAQQPEQAMRLVVEQT